jgi:hypothetical protein
VRHTLLLPALAAVVLAAGCGGSSQPETTTDWANGLCTAITTWKSSITSAADSLKGGDISKASLQSAYDDVRSATSTFEDDIKGLGKPDTQAGEQAKDLLGSLAQEVDDGVQTIKDAVDSASSVTGILKAVSVASATLGIMASQVSLTFRQLRNLDAAGELESAFKDADSCASLTASAS